MTTSIPNPLLNLPIDNTEQSRSDFADQTGAMSPTNSDNPFAVCIHDEPPGPKRRSLTVVEWIAAVFFAFLAAGATYYVTCTGGVALSVAFGTRLHLPLTYQ